MSLQCSSHSTGSNNMGFHRREDNAGLKRIEAAYPSSFDYVGHEEGEKHRFHHSDRIPRQSLHEFFAEKRRGRWIPAISSRLHLQMKQSPPIRIMTLTSADNGLHLKPQRSSVNNPLKPSGKAASYECVRRRPRLAEVDCLCGKNHPGGEGSAWKDGPFGVLWYAEEIAQTVDGEVVASASPGSISTDSRKINEGEWFLPLVGSNFDGHQFLQQALDRGCAGVIGRAVSTDWPTGYIRVERDTLRVLHRLAVSVRGRYGGPVVGITGSTGKTTTRAMTALALESLGAIHQTEDNLNNHIGLPLTLLKLPSSSSACVLEMGMSHPGEILVLAEIAQPSVRVLLNVGPAHTENFKSLEDVAEAKAELLSKARPGDVCVLNADDPLVMNMALPRGVRVVFFGTREGCHLKVVRTQATRGGRAVRVALEQLHPASTWVKNFSSGSQILEHLIENSTKSNTSDPLTSSTGSHVSNLLTRIPTSSQSTHPNPDPSFQSIERFSSTGPELVSRVEFEIPSPGLHLAIGACAATAVAVSLGVPLQAAGESLSKYSPIGMRSRLEMVGAIQLIDDTYNSNPMSLEAGLKLLASMECEGERIALLGDMLELGSVSKKAHLVALTLCRLLDLDMVGLVGPSFSEAACSQGLDKGNCDFAIFQDSEELAGKIRAIVRPGDVVLVKGSRGMKMEIAANAIRTMAQLV